MAPVMKRKDSAGLTGEDYGAAALVAIPYVCYLGVKKLCHKCSELAHHHKDKHHKDKHENKAEGSEEVKAESDVHCHSHCTSCEVAQEVRPWVVTIPLRLVSHLFFFFSFWAWQFGIYRRSNDTSSVPTFREISLSSRRREWGNETG